MINEPAVSQCGDNVSVATLAAQFIEYSNFVLNLGKIFGANYFSCEGLLLLVLPLVVKPSLFSC